MKSGNILICNPHFFKNWKWLYGDSDILDIDSKNGMVLFNLRKQGSLISFCAE